MTIPTSPPCLKRILAAAAAALLAGPALAQQQSAITNEPYLVPENSVGVGVEHGSGDQKDRARSGMFDGLRKHDTNGIFNFNVTDRNAESGRWLIFEGRNLGLDNRELSGTWRGLGDFKLKAEYGEITRHDPRTINTGVGGIGSTNLTVPLLPGPGLGYGPELRAQAQGVQPGRHEAVRQFPARSRVQAGKQGWRALFRAGVLPAVRTMSPRAFARRRRARCS